MPISVEVSGAEKVRDLRNAQDTRFREERILQEDPFPSTFHRTNAAGINRILVAPVQGD